MAFVIAMVVGAVAVVGGIWVARATGGATGQPVPTATSIVPVSTVEPSGGESAPLDEVAFPPGFVPVDGFVALSPVAALEVDGRLFVTMASAVRRGFDPGVATPFESGDWVLTTSDGDEIESESTTFDTGAPGSFSVVFPFDGSADAAPAILRLVGAWRRHTGFGMFEIGDVTVPYADEGPLTVDTDAGVVTIEDLTVDEFEGGLTWSVTGSRPAIVQAWVVLGGDNGEVYRAIDAPRFAGFGRAYFTEPEGVTGDIALVRESNASVGDQPQPMTVQVDVTFLTRVRAAADFDVSGLSVDRP